MARNSLKEMFEGRTPITLELDKDDFRDLKNYEKYNYWQQYVDKLKDEINGDNLHDLDIKDLDSYINYGVVEIEFNTTEEYTKINCVWIDEEEYYKCIKDPSKDLSDCERKFEDFAIIKKWDETEEEEFEFWLDVIFRYSRTRNVELW